jgi:hypothetical protein
MPITVQYGDAGLAGTLAVQAGRSDAYRRQQAIDMQAIQMSLAATAQQRQSALAEREMALKEKAFQIQNAVQAQMEAQQQRTPVAGAVRSQSEISALDKQAAQETYRKQIDAMAEAGSITPAQHQRAILAAMTGNETLMAQALAAERPAISPMQELELIRAPFAARREGVQAALKNTLGESAAKTLRDQLDAILKEEAAAILEWKQKVGLVPAPAEAEPSVAPIQVTTYPKSWTADEKRIYEMGHRVPGANFGIRGERPTTRTIDLSEKTRKSSPPAEYPDAEWNEQRKMWTVIRNGRLYGVQ